MRGAPVALAALAAVLLLASVPGASQDAPHGAYNRSAAGASDAAAAADQVLHGPIVRLDPGATLLVVGPSRAYTDAEVDAVRAFLAAGGRLLVADDVGAGRSLLARLDVGLTLARVPVYTPVFGDDPREVVASAGGLPGWPEEVTLRRPRAVLGEGEALLLSHPLSWLDLDDDGRPDLDEPRGAFAFARRQAVGAGELLVIGSPRVLDNAGHPLRDGVLQWAREGGRTVVFDDAHRAAVDPVRAAWLLAGQASWAWWLLPAAVAAVALRTFQVRPVRVSARRMRRPRAGSPVLEELEP